MTPPIPSPSPPPFVGRAEELARLSAAILERESLLIFGPPDSGKTALVDRALAQLPPRFLHQSLRVSAAGALKSLLQRHVLQLLAAGDPLVRADVRSQPSRSRRIESWVRNQTSRRLRSLLLRALDARPYWIFWDDACRLGMAHHHLLREIIWMRKTPVYLLAQGLARDQVGEPARLFWANSRQLEMGPLGPADANALLREAIGRAGLSALGPPSFPAELLAASRSLPGAILGMVDMAGQPRYRHGNCVKTKLVHVDYLLQLAIRAKAGPGR